MEYVVSWEENTGVAVFSMAACGSLDPSLVSALSKSGLACFLPYQVKDEGRQTIHIEVSTIHLDPLARVVEQPMGQSTLSALCRHFHNLIEACVFHGLPFMNVVLDAELIFYDRIQDDMRFIYLPVASTAKDASAIQESFQIVVKGITPADTRAKDMHQQLMAALATREPLNLMSLSSLLRHLAHQSEDEEGSCEEKPATQAGWKSGRHVREDPGTSVLHAVNLEGLPFPDLEHGEGAFRHAGAGLSVAKAVPKHRHLRHRLIHKASGLISPIDEDGLTVGKSKHATFQVPHTTTVSRIHATLTAEDGFCCIQDAHSLNGTFVNDCPLESGGKAFLKDGDVIRMADEEFQFETQLTKAGE